MSKNKRLNKHKGPVKVSTKKFYDKRFEVEGSPKLLKGGEFAYIAFDSCAVINMAKVECHTLDTAFNNRKEKALKQNLEELKNHSAIKNGFVCDRGKYVLCIVPAVLEEVDMGGKQYSHTIQRHLKEMYLVLDIKPEYRPQFDLLTQRIMQDFEKHGLFVNEFGSFMEHDAKITAQAAILNLTIASQDAHLTSIINGHREHIKFWSSRHLPGDHNGRQAVPMNLCEIMNLIRNEDTLSQLENSFILTDETRKKLERLKYRPSEYARPNPTLSELQTESPLHDNKPTVLGKKPSFVFARQHE